jgi:hypothetical protein
MQQTFGRLINAAEYARMRGLNRSTISRQIASGAIPTVGGLLDPRAADLARERNLNGVRREQAARRKVEQEAERRPTMEIPKSRKRTGTDGHLVQASTDPDVRAAVADTLRRAAAPEEILTFARVALRAGCSKLQAFILATWFSLQPALIAFENLDTEDLNSFEQPSETQWYDLLGKDFDLNGAEDELDRLTWPETSPAA